MAKPTRFTQEMIDEYVSRGYWDLETLADLCGHHAREYPDEEAFSDSKSRLTWLQLKHLSDGVALGLLGMGLKKDQTVVVQLPNWVENVILRIAFLKAGVLSMFPPMTWRHTEMEHALKSLGAVGVIIPYRFRRVDYYQMILDIRSHLPHLEHVIVVGEETPSGAVPFNKLYQPQIDNRHAADYLTEARFHPLEVTNVMATSGTTGVPKFCEHSQVMHKLLGRALVERARISREDVVAAIGPLSGGAALFGFTCPILAAARCALLGWFEAEAALRLIEKERATVAIVVPAQLIAMLRHPNFSKYDLTSLRVVRAGGAATPPNIAAEVERRVGCKFLSGAGAMDAAGISQASVDDPPEVRYVTAGRPVTGNEVKLIDDQGNAVPQGEVGELLVRGACTASGYYRDIQATLDAWGELGEWGWWRSGDLAKFDAHGNIVFVGRKKDVIIRGAQNIYPVEIENLLYTHPKVAQVAIVGMPDPLMGEKACAWVVPKPGQVFTFDEMAAFLRGKNIAPYKLPERLEVVDRLPTAGDVGKVDKKALAKEIAEKLRGEGKA